MDTIDHLLARTMAQDAVIFALIATHPRKAELATAIEQAALHVSTTALGGDFVLGTQAAFDKIVASYIRIANPA